MMSLSDSAVVACYLKVAAAAWATHKGSYSGKANVDDDAFGTRSTAPSAVLQCEHRSRTKRSLFIQMLEILQGPHTRRC